MNSLAGPSYIYGPFPRPQRAYHPCSSTKALNRMPTQPNHLYRLQPGPLVTRKVTMSVQRRRSLYLLPNAPIIKEEFVEATSPTAELSEEKKWPAPLVRNTILDLLDRTVSFDNRGEEEVTDNEKKAELQLFGSEKHMPTLQDLSNLLYTRGRLQELGCTFTDMGELITYGYPVTLKENEQLFRLGPIYDEQWSSFFSTAHTIRTDGDAVMWADIRTLKRVLVNDGVAFNCSHQRLTYGDGSAKLIRLCAAYDDLYKLWSSEKPTHVLTPIDEEEEAEEGFDDSGCFLDEECSVDDNTKAFSNGSGGARRASSLTTQREPQPVPPERRPKQRESRPLEHKSGLTHRVPEAQPEPATTCCDENNRNSVPRNIGWRFSVDIVRCRDSLSDYSDEELEEDLDVAVEVSAPMAEDDPARVPSPVQPETPKQDLPLTGDDKSLQPISHTRWQRSLSPLRVWCGCKHKCSAEQLTDVQNFTTTSMIYTEQPPKNPHDSASTSSSGADPKTHATSNSASSKKKSFRRWVRGVFGRVAS
jgi:hypothetical protein